MDQDYARFERFVRFFCRAFKEPGLLDGVDCRQSHKDYLPQYYDKLFVRPDGVGPRHLKWLQRLRPLLAAVPEGATVLDYGGGYGLDAVLLASLGRRVVFYEISPHHLAIGMRLAARFGEEVGPLDITPVLASPARDEAIAPVDAVLLNEVAHHIEPIEDLFAHCARLLKPGGRLFLLEPNWWNPLTQAFFFRVRGFRTVVEQTDEATGRRYLYGNEHIRPRGVWDRAAAGAGLSRGPWWPIVSYGLSGPDALDAPWRRALAGLPGVNAVAASHITHEYVKPG